MQKIMGGMFFTDSHIEVVDWENNGLKYMEVRPPKIIVGVSITGPKESFDKSHLVFPAVVDTGCNKAFDIDERHLYYWNATPKNSFDLIERKNPNAQRDTGYDIREARIWLHVEPYTGPRFLGPRNPVPLYASDQIRVRDPRNNYANPRFPLLGLECLVQNNILLFVDGRSSEFEMND